MWHSHVTPPPSLWPCGGIFLLKEKKKKEKNYVLGGPWGRGLQGLFLFKKKKISFGGLLGSLEVRVFFCFFQEIFF